MSLNPGQLAAVNAQGHCLIVACPGSGKTHTLTQRGERLLLEDPNRRIGIVTFTRAAANELRDRLLAKVGGSAASRVDAGTFHSLCLQQLDAVYSVNGKRPFEIASEGKSEALIYEAWDRAVKHFRSFVKRDVVKAGIEYAKANNGAYPISRNGDNEIIRFAHIEYQKMLESQKLLDFADIMAIAVKGMCNGRVRPLNVTHLLVDEFQDTDAIQLDWVLAHVAFGSKVTCVGDDDQSIFKFRHAKGYNGMMQFARETAAQTITLDTTYRCSAVVMAHAMRLIRHNQERVPKTISSNSTAQGYVDRFDFNSFDDEVQAACEYMRHRPAGKSGAILARSNAVLRMVEMYLMENQIPYQGGVDGGFWNGGAPGLVAGLFGAALGRDVVGATMALTCRGLKHNLIDAAKKQIEASNRRMDALLASDSWLSGIKDSAQLDAWNGLKGEYRALVGAASHGVAAYTDACLRFIAPGVDGFTSENALEAIRNILGRMDGSLADIHRRIKDNSRKSEEDKSRKDGLSLMTLHASKGLEFDYVWMTALCQGVLPHANSELDEERRLCYVGMTRARTHLTMSYARTKDAPESVFLKEAGLPNANVFRKRA